MRNIIVRTEMKTSSAGLICAFTNTTAASDCQTTNGHNLMRLAWARDRWLWKERLWERKVLKREWKRHKKGPHGVKDESVEMENSWVMDGTE